MTNLISGAGAAVPAIDARVARQTKLMLLLPAAVAGGRARRPRSTGKLGSLGLYLRTAHFFALAER